MNIFLFSILIFFLQQNNQEVSAKVGGNKIIDVENAFKSNLDAKDRASNVDIRLQKLYISFNLFLEFSKADAKSKETAFKILDSVLADEVIKASKGPKDYNDAIENIDVGALFKFLKPFLPIVSKIVQDYPEEVAKTLTCLKPLLGKLMSEFLGGGKGDAALGGLLGGLLGGGDPKPVM